MFNISKPYNKVSILPWEEKDKLESSDMTLPTVSIVIPIFNSGKFLEKTLRSLLCNNLNGVEIILMDGGSSDDTMEIVEHYKGMFSYIESEKDKGQSDAINKGFDRATGDILYWLNGDDIILPNTLNKVREYYSSNQECEILVGNAFMTEIDFTPIRHFVFSVEKLKFEYLLDYAKNHLIQPSVFFSHQAWKKVEKLDVNDHYAMDADLFIGMAKLFGFHHINLDIAYSVYHEDCKTRGARAESITALALVQAKHGGIIEATSTLNILIDLYHELEQLSVGGAKEAYLSSKLNTIEKQVEEQKKLLLEVDLVENI